MPPEPVALENKAKATLMAILIRLLVLSGSSSYNQGIREWFSYTMLVEPENHDFHSQAL